MHLPLSPSAQPSGARWPEARQLCIGRYEFFVFSSGYRFDFVVACHWERGDLHLGVIGSAMFADARIAQLIQREQEQAQAAAKLASANLNQRLAHAQSIASTLALDPTVQLALGRFGPNAQASTLPVTERGDMWRADPMLTPHRHAHGANGGQVRSQHPLGHQRGWRRPHEKTRHRRQPFHRYQLLRPHLLQCCPARHLRTPIRDRLSHQRLRVVFLVSGVVGWRICRHGRCRTGCSQIRRHH